MHTAHRYLTGNISRDVLNKLEEAGYELKPHSNYTHLPPSDEIPRCGVVSSVNYEGKIDYDNVYVVEEDISLQRGTPLIPWLNEKIEEQKKIKFIEGL